MEDNEKGNIFTDKSDDKSNTDNNENLNRTTGDLNIERRSLIDVYRELVDEKNELNKEHKTRNIFNITCKSSFDVRDKKKNLEKKAFRNCIRQIELIPNKGELNLKSNYQGALYKLFNSEYFDIHMLLCYIDKKEEQGIVDTLVNFMHQKFINESFFYIPQLCTMITYKLHYESLENYILDRCVDQMKFSLKVHWLISSYIENAEDSKIVKKYDKIIQRIEMTLVNGRRATLSNFKLYNSLHIKTEEEVYKHSLDKEYRLNYFDKVVRFYYDLKMLCEKLKDFPKDNYADPKKTRNAIMRKNLKKFNKNIKSMTESLQGNEANTTTKSLFRGFILPFDDSNSTMDDYNSLIVNFLPEYSFCFSTKARVPVKITFEVVRVLECAYWDELCLEDDFYDDEILKTEENLPTLSSCNDCNKCNICLNIDASSKEIEASLNIIEYSSLDDFFKKISKPLPDEDYKTKETQKEIEKIVNNIKKANENSNFVPRPSRSNIKDYLSSEIPSLKEESYLFDNSAGVVNPFGTVWSDTIKQIKEVSRFKKFESWGVKSFIAKANDDLRQEVMTMQLIKRFHEVFTAAEIPLKLRPYEILITSPSSGLIEFLPNTISIDSLKKNLPLNWNLNLFFRNFFTNNFEEAQKNFAQSLAAYSLITYIINIKDRHNGNILMDMNGHLIHIDFGFILGISPGNLNFENAPFKLTNEYIDILDGPESNLFHYFKSLILRGLIELRKHVDSFVKIIEIMVRGSKMPCFYNNDNASVILKFIERFHANKSESEYIRIVDELIYNSLNNWRTTQYDYFQKLTNDIRP